MKNIVVYIVCLFPMIVYSQSHDDVLSSSLITNQTSQQQKVDGSILGTVIDIVDRSPIEKATVEVLGTGLKVMTLKDGQFKITNITEGFYQVRATAEGYDVQTQNNLYVDNAKPATAFFMLKKSGLKETEEAENSAPVPISTKMPYYPDEARKNGVEGIFYFVLQISETGSIVTAKCAERNVFAEDGKLKDAEVFKKFPQAVNQLEKEALESIWQWKFKPALKDGKPISSHVTLPVKFKLDSPHKDMKKEKK